MPSAPKQSCAAPGCPELVSGVPRCPKHQKQRYRECDSRRGSPSERGYDRAWQRLRALKLEADPFCEIRTHCANRSITHQAATEVDHIISIRERPDLRLVLSNLRSACKSCHSARTMRDSVRADRQ